MRRVVHEEARLLAGATCDGCSFVRLSTEVSAWLHPLVEHPYDLHQAGLNDAVE
jgi:hypothetical protein